MNVVWCIKAMEHFGKVVSDVLSWPLYAEIPVPSDTDTVYMIGMYDPPHYVYSLEMTKAAKRRIIHWCGNDVNLMVRPDLLPEAVHLCESPLLAEMLHHKGIVAKVAPFPTHIHPEVTPLPDEPVVTVYLGTNGQKYGESTVRALMEMLPDVKFVTYAYGTYTPEHMPLTIARSRVCLRLVYPDGSANSARESMEAGRRAVTAVAMDYATRISPSDLAGIAGALRRALKHDEPDWDAAAYYHEFNSKERYLHDLEGVL